MKGIGDAVLNKLKAEATVSSAAPKAAQPAVKNKPDGRLCRICRPEAEPLPVRVDGRLCMGSGNEDLDQWGQ